ncbi:MAG: hypothetical protein CMH54_02785 [Myxococcales bacterium]|nr:hypothetical protein [Myxococcales bacterium]
MVRFLVILGLVLPVWVQPAEAKGPREIQRASEATVPPTIYMNLLKSISAVNYHVNDRHKKGYEAKTICPNPSARKGFVDSRVCKGLQRSYHASIVKDSKDRQGQTVVQNLWLWEYSNARAAKRARKHMDDMTFQKRIYEVLFVGPHLIIVEGRWRFRTEFKRLVKHVKGFLQSASSKPAEKPNP